MKTDLEIARETLADREVAHIELRCVKPPLGCGKVLAVDSFKDWPSKQEYIISGLCQECQDRLFVEEQS